MEEPKNPYEPTEPTVPKKVEEEGFCLSCLYWLIMIPLAILGLIFVFVSTCTGPENAWQEIVRAISVGIDLFLE